MKNVSNHLSWISSYQPKNRELWTWDRRAMNSAGNNDSAVTTEAKVAFALVDIQETWCACDSLLFLKSVFWSVGKVLMLNSSSPRPSPPSVIQPLSHSFSLSVSLSRWENVTSGVALLSCCVLIEQAVQDSVLQPEFHSHWLGLIDLGEEPRLQVTSLDVTVITRTAIYTCFLHMFFLW